MNTTPAGTKTRARLTLLALMAVFVLPLLLAWGLARGPFDWRPQSNLNYGVLLQPPLQLNAFGVMPATGTALTKNAIARDWFVVVLYNEVCTLGCQQLMEAAERIQIAVGRDVGRVSLALLGSEAITPAPPGNNLWLAADAALGQALRQASGEPQFDAKFLIVDYQGYVVLMYPPSEEGPGVLEDLKRLLRTAAT
jgi:hypothetical protein